MSHEILPSDRAAEEGGETSLGLGWPSWRFEPMASVLRMVRLVGPTDVTVLILGETGVGKEMVAHSLHRVSPRHEGPFVKINCAAMPRDLLESELFGYERGAFTGADRRKQGRFERADGGTIFLDEIGEMALPLQAKLLHVLQDATFSRLGGNEEIRADVRIVAATNRDLRTLAERAEFREDLYYRLSVVNIRLAALRERPDEISALIRQFLDTFALRDGRARPRLSAETLQRLTSYHWPGNVRELENIIRQLVLLGENAGILDNLLAARPAVSRPEPPDPEPRAVPRNPAPGPPAESENLGLSAIAERARQGAERHAIERALAISRWRRTEAARLLKISYRTLLRKMREYDLG
ncbi:MAG: sigma-54 interaction domain-containing protein [Candidatus Rokuibacteriota bacterium]